MLQQVRRLAVPQLAAFHTQVDVRAPAIRISSYDGTNVASDYGLVYHASPPRSYPRRSEVTIVLEGTGRFEERGRRSWLTPRSIALSDQRRGGTEAFAGVRHRYLIIDWSDDAIGAPLQQRFRVEALAPRDLRRIDDASRLLGGPRAADAVRAIVAVLRSWGLDLPADIDLGPPPERADYARLYAVCGERLSNLGDRPAIQELVDALRSSERQVHRDVRRMARRYALPFSHWRGALRQARLVQAIRLLAAPGATTDCVARLTGFASPAALCRAFADGDLPSPGMLARAARRDVLASWADLVPSMVQAADG